MEKHCVRDARIRQYAVARCTVWSSQDWQCQSRAKIKYTNIVSCGNPNNASKATKDKIQTPTQQGNLASSLIRLAEI
jgi:hypothetical protein